MSVVVSSLSDSAGLQPACHCCTDTLSLSTINICMNHERDANRGHRRPTFFGLRSEGMNRLMGLIRHLVGLEA